MSCAYFIVLFPLMLGYGAELAGNNDFYNRKIYNNFGNAISISNELNADLFISEAVATAIPWGPELLFKTHPENKPYSLKKISVIKHRTAVPKAQDKAAVYIDSSTSYTVIDQRPVSR